jgi:hypothetical protein
MELIKTIPGRDAKLDGILALLFQECSGSTISQQTFYENYGELFGEDFNDLQQILFEDGLVKSFVGPDGFEMEITRDGIDFMSTGGYSRDIREELIYHGAVLKSMRNLKTWNTVVLLCFFLALVFCFYLTHRKA